jgi:hypothetical protein
MWNYIVLGQIPGTSIQLGFVAYLLSFSIGLVIYDLKKFHPQRLKRISKKLKINILSKRLKKVLKKEQKKLMRYQRKLFKKFAKRFISYKKWLFKKLTHFRDNVLGPKLKFLK